MNLFLTNLFLALNQYAQLDFGKIAYDFKMGMTEQLQSLASVMRELKDADQLICCKLQI